MVEDEVEVIAVVPMQFLNSAPTDTTKVLENVENEKVDHRAEPTNTQSYNEHQLSVNFNCY